MPRSRRALPDDGGRVRQDEVDREDDLSANESAQSVEFSTSAKGDDSYTGLKVHFLKTFLHEISVG